VVEGQGGALTGLVSFYTLPSSVLGHREHSEIRAAYMYYTGETGGQPATQPVCVWGGGVLRGQAAGVCYVCSLHTVRAACR
jgi:hypothetical protein